MDEVAPAAIGLVSRAVAVRVFGSNVAGLAGLLDGIQLHSLVNSRRTPTLEHYVPLAATMVVDLVLSRDAVRAVCVLVLCGLGFVLADQGLNGKTLLYAFMDAVEDMGQTLDAMVRGPGRPSHVRRSSASTVMPSVTSSSASVSETVRSGTTTPTQIAAFPHGYTPISMVMPGSYPGRSDMSDSRSYFEEHYDPFSPTSRRAPSVRSELSLGALPILPDESDRDLESSYVSESEEKTPRARTIDLQPLDNTYVPQTEGERLPKSPGSPVPFITVEGPEERHSSSDTPQGATGAEDDSGEPISGSSSDTLEDTANSTSMDDDYQSTVSIPDSVITVRIESKTLDRASEFRRQAREAQARAQEYEVQRELAHKEERYYDAFHYRNLRDQERERVAILNKKAEKRYFHANNHDLGDDVIDVHGLSRPEAVRRIERALWQAQQRGSERLSVVVGHTTNKPDSILALKDAVLDTLKNKHNLEAEDDPESIRQINVTVRPPVTSP